ncbi:PP28 phosphoprotein [Chloropicon primus]|uniref:Casein kinase substrate phosphoprotein PP28 domain-containing protein n=1 Tax=Chloropicon primus TaxID=1764295 RepID=A0A5B8MIP5_9CHLO|nr:hypothetical protein A3770_04p28350 [Chloropicon primus]UPQ99527.1 PP28 phosphoprotein [Chloropicon primus]|eukprot:QDZ20317.1 hypothetical protein A3770_04p28350 [Chloropicon primus]
MGRGPRRGGRKRFTDFKTLEAEAKELKERKEREANGEEVTSSEEEGETESESEETSSEEERRSGEAGKKKGVEGLIEVNNPNFKPKKAGTKARDADLNSAPTLTRREREALEAQRSKERYFKLQKEGKTEQARKDLERLALIRKQREEAAKKRAEEKAKKEAAGSKKK